MHSDPKSIGRYTVQRVLGRGAMGVVYLAMDPLLKRPVAIKTLRDAGDEDAAITMERFNREAEISARLNHPNIITVFDVGADPVAGPFLAMEYIDGTNLSTLIRQRPDPDACLRLLIQAMSALMAAEQGGIVHRDVKPENMLVGRDGRLKLMDFGIARGDESRLTQAGMVFGTPSYTAPELLVGGEANPGTDHYAFFVTAFELCTGTLPFQGSSVASTLYKVVHEPPVLPPNLDPGLAEVFLRGLAKDPKDRFQDLPSFMVALCVALPLSDEQRARILAMLDGDVPVGSTRSIPVVRTEQLPEIRNTPTVATGPNHFEEPSSRSFPTPVPAPLPEDSGPRRSEPAPKPPSGSRGAALKIGAGLLLAAGLGGGGWVAWKQFGRPKTHSLSIRTEPAGAEVFLNGQSLGRTPLGPFEIADDRASGVLRIQMDGYETLQERLEPDDKLLEYTLVRPTYEIAVATDPKGAEALLNGQSVGKTPLQVKVPGGGSQVLELKLEGYAVWKATLEKDIPFPALVTLTPLAFRAAVLSEPKGAEVFVDKRSVGRTPLPALEVSSEGRHEVRLRLEGYEDWVGRLEKDKPLPKPVKLNPKRFRVEIRSEPAGASVFVDGQKVGTTPHRAELPVVGSHTLRVSLEGHQEFTSPLGPETRLPDPIRLVPLKKAESPKAAPKAEEKKPGFWKRIFGGKKGETEKK